MSGQSLIVQGRFSPEPGCGGSQTALEEQVVSGGMIRLTEKRGFAVGEWGMMVSYQLLSS